MWIDQHGRTVGDNETYTDPHGTSYPGWAKSTIPGLTRLPDPEPTAEEMANAFTAAKTVGLVRIDADTDAVYGVVLGNRAEEYTRAATEAQAYKDAGYTGTVPASVQSWATAKSWTATQAADDILATAVHWIGAQTAIRANRLLRKEEVRNASDISAVANVLATWAGFVSYIRGQLGVS